MDESQHDAHGDPSVAAPSSARPGAAPVLTHPEQPMRHGRRATDPAYRIDGLPTGQGKEGSSKDGAKDGDDDRASGDKDSDKDQGDKKDAKGGKGGKDGKDEDGGDDDKKPRSKKPLIILAVVILILAIVGFIWWFATRNEVSTDDAYTDGNAVTMAPKVSGYVTELAINDNVRVKKGQLLMRIDNRDYLAARADAEGALGLAQAQLESANIALAIARVQYPAQLAQAQAQEKSAQANLGQAQSSYDRQHAVDKRATTLESIDASNSQQAAAAASVASARAQVQVAALVRDQVRQAEATVAQRTQQLRQAQAKLEQANLNVSYCDIVAPTDGWVAKRNVQLGSYLAAGTPMFLLITPEIWVTANFKESQLTRMRVGDGVRLKVDAFPGLDLHGHVDSFQLGSGSKFAAFPTENATGNFVKIVQRVPVKIVIDRGLDPNAPLPLGLSVSPVVDLE